MRLGSSSLNKIPSHQVIRRLHRVAGYGRPSTLTMQHEPVSKAAESHSLLFVDDDRLVLATLAEGLNDAGYRVTTASSAKTAMDYAAKTPFDLAILDVRMPEISGIDLAASLRDDFNISSIFLSAFGDQQTVNGAVREGGLGFLLKPVTVAKLIPAIQAAVARANDIKELNNYSSSLEKALSSSRLVSVAIGILMAKQSLTEKEAFEYLRSTSRNQRRKMEAVAAEIVSSLHSSFEDNGD